VDIGSMNMSRIDGIEWKVVVEQVPYADQKRIWILQIRSNGEVYNANAEKDGHLLMKLFKEGDPMPVPFMILPRMVWEQFVEAMTEIQPPVEKEVVDAELKATRYHLEDMRKLAGLVGSNVRTPLLCSNCGCENCECKND